MNKDLNNWLSKIDDYSILEVNQIHSDASFRNYYRIIDADKGSFIVMESDPNLEDNKKFERILSLLDQVSMPVPKIYEKDDSGRYYLLSDLGLNTLFDEVNEKLPLNLYQQAISLLTDMQLSSMSLLDNLPKYDKALLYAEMELFKEWFCFYELRLSIQEIERINFEDLYNELIFRAVNQEDVFVHRDFHSRNLVISDINKISMVDFQDAVSGPITYDIVSLLRDCYVKINPDQMHLMLSEYYDQLIQNQMTEKSLKEFMIDFDLMGAQRHLKAIGIFSRLKHRDNKNNYINDIPLTLSYLQDLSKQYEFIDVVLKQLKLSR